MAKREARLSVVYTALARTDLIGIWEWNATQKQSRGRWHIIFYETSEHELRIMTILHTAQDWLSRFRPD